MRVRIKLFSLRGFSTKKRAKIVFKKKLASVCFVREKPTPNN